MSKQVLEQDALKAEATLAAFLATHGDAIWPDEERVLRSALTILRVRAAKL